jgi:hypothetical protein
MGVMPYYILQHSDNREKSKIRIDIKTKKRLYGGYYPSFAFAHKHKENLSRINYKHSDKNLRIYIAIVEIGS